MTRVSIYLFGFCFFPLGLRSRGLFGSSLYGRVPVEKELDNNYAIEHNTENKA